MALPTDCKPRLDLSFIFGFPVVVPWVCHMDVSYPEKLVVTRYLFVQSSPQAIGSGTAAREGKGPEVNWKGIFTSGLRRFLRALSVWYCCCLSSRMPDNPFESSLR